MVRLVVRGPQEPIAAEFAALLAARLTQALQARRAVARVLGPAPAPLARLKGEYRFQVQIQGPDGDKLRAAAGAATAEIPVPERVQWIVDVDPINML
jgi:primosomal protein N' (replication factor Y)